jgi:hypothetical protein
MRQVGRAVISSDGKILLAKSKDGKPPVAFINWTLVKGALGSAGISTTSLDIVKNEALLELIQYMKENEF